ncbi:MAG: hypothetical protein KDB03_22290 [Planctomycetales bacterium]|nr:hypothetical protein [Planctomycetales bacterium]
MPPDGNQIDELLSALLDNELSGEELSYVKGILSSDAELQARLESMRALRGELRQLLRTPSVGSGFLDHRFAERVVAAAQKRAVQSGLAEDHHVRLAEHSAISHIARTKIFSRRVVYAVATAASIGAIWLSAIYFGSWSKSSGNSQIAQVPEQSVANTDVASLSETGRDGTGQVAFNPFPQGVESTPNNTTSIESQEGSLAANVLPGGISLLFVVDVSITRQAFEGGKLEELFSRTGIHVAGALQADRNLTEALQNALTIIPSDESAEALHQGFVFMVSAKAKSIDSVLSQIQLDRQSFPVWAYNMAYDTPSSRLLELLSKGQSSSPGQQLAVGIGLGGQGSASPMSFDVSLRRPKLVSAVNREALQLDSFVPPQSVFDESALSTVLFVLHVAD